jgi:UDP-N-acetylmuramyl tripeptide synthase
MRQALIDHGVADERITIVHDELEAANTAMDRAKQDDLVVLLVDRPELVWQQVVERSTRQQQLVAV